MRSFAPPSCALVFALTLGCQGGAEVDPTDVVPDSEPVVETDLEPARYELGEPVSCAAPLAGPARFTDSAAERGLVHSFRRRVAGEQDHCSVLPGNIVVEDFDHDGDLDVATMDWPGELTVFEGHGDGTFSPVDLPLRLRPGNLFSVSAVDLDGDGLHELLSHGEGLVVLARGIGPLAWGGWETLFEAPGYPRTCFSSVTWGDIDLDDDLDLYVTGFDGLLDENTNRYGDPPTQPVGGTDQLLLADGGVFVPHPIPQSYPGVSMVGIFTDADHDGDLDIWAPSSRPQESGSYFWRFDGLDGTGAPELTEDHQAKFGGYVANAMGVDSYDFNNDGLLDYCVSTIGTWMACQVSTGAAGWFDAGAAMGAVSTPTLHPDYQAYLAGGGPVVDWATWSVELVDVDNDGFVDLATAAGDASRLSAIGGSDAVMSPDALWMGVPGGFVDRSRESGLDVTSDNYGLVAADLDRDGHHEILVGGWGTTLKVWDNPCSAGAWLGLDLIGPPHNVGGYGARVTVTVGERTLIRELYGVRGIAQGPSLLHFGFGDVDVVDRIHIRWADGRVDVLTDVPTRRYVRVLHAAAEEVSER
jgi:hypothetical protein